MITAITDKTFRVEVLNADRPCLVVFTAEWAGPCLMVTHVLPEVDKVLNGQVKIVTADIDECTKTARHLGLTGIPMSILFNNGLSEWAAVGMLNVPEIVSFVERALGVEA